MGDDLGGARLGDEPKPHDLLDHMAWLLRGDGVADVTSADALDTLVLLRGERGKLDELELRAIALLRRHEVGWTAIGRALGYPHGEAMRDAIQRHGMLQRQLRQVTDELRDHLGRSPS